MILEIYRDCLPYSIKDKKTLLKLGIISILSFLIFPIVFLFGYSYRTIKTGLEGAILENNDPLPSFSNLKQLFIQGLKTIIVIVAYVLIPSIISILAIFRFNLMEFTHFLSSFKIDFQLDFGIGFLLLLITIWFITFTLTTTGISHMINRNSMQDAFKFRELIKIIRHVGLFEYFKFFLSFIIMAIAFGIIGIIATEIILNIMNIIALSFYNFTFKGPSGLFLTIIILNIISSFILIPIFLITESRVTSFIYNDDGLEEEY